MTNATPASIVLGTMDYGTTIDPGRAFDILDAFVDHGGTWLDTANCYSFWGDPSGVGGASERVIGGWLRERSGVRSRIRIATKVRQDPLVPHRWPETAEGLSAEAIERGFAGSLDRLELDSVDLLWAHAEDRSVPLEETVEAFGSLVARGQVTRLGAANHACWRVQQARDLARDRGIEAWTALQLRHSLVQTRPQASFPEAGQKMLTPDDLDLAQTEGLDLWAYTPLLHGAYTRSDKSFSEGYDHPGTTRVLAVLDDVARELDATVNQVVLAWLLAQGISPIVGASRVEHVTEVMPARDLTLTSEHLARFDAAR